MGSGWNPDAPYADEDSRVLQTGVCEADHVLLRVTDGDEVAEVCVTRRDLPSVVARLYEAPGLPAPVILDRPADPALALSVIPGLKFTARNGGVDVERPGSGWLAEPEVIRHLAAALAILADKAETAPDPAEVDALSKVIFEAHASPSDAVSRPVEMIARAILHAGYSRKEPS